MGRQYPYLFHPVEFLLIFELLQRTRTWRITKDEQGCHHLPPTPSNLWGKLISNEAKQSKHHASIINNTPAIPSYCING